MPVCRIPAFAVPMGAALFALILPASGCGGGSSGPDGGSSTAGPPPLNPLGSRAMPEGSISVALEGAIRAGQPATILVEVPAQYPGVARVDALLISDGQAGAPANATTPRSAGRYALQVPVASWPPADSARVFVRLVHVSGDIVESGREDFVLPR